MQQLLEVGPGTEFVSALIPKVLTVKPNQVQLVELGDKEVGINIGDAGRFNLGGAVGKSFRARTGMDFNMMRKLSSETQTACWKELVEAGEDEITFKVRAEEVISIPKEKQSVIDQQRFLSRFVERVQPQHFANISNRRDHIDFGLVTGRIKSPPKKVDDLVHEGMFVSFNGDTEVHPYNMRLICTNGQIAPRRGKGYIVNEENFDSTVSEVLSEVDRFTQSFVDLAEKRIGDAGGIVGRLSRMDYLNSSQVSQIVERLSSLGDEATEFDLVNLITMLQHEGGRSKQWMEAGGRIVEYLAHDHCDKCGSAN